MDSKGCKKNLDMPAGLTLHGGPPQRLTAEAPPPMPETAHREGWPSAAGERTRMSMEPRS